jgi:hypothetical protein
MLGRSLNKRWLWASSSRGSLDFAPLPTLILDPFPLLTGSCSLGAWCSATKSCPEDGAFGIGAHSDYGMITFLATDGVPGLQVWGPWAAGRMDYALHTASLGLFWDVYHAHKEWAEMLRELEPAMKSAADSATCQRHWTAAWDRTQWPHLPTFLHVAHPPAHLSQFSNPPPVP